jgi:excinuclease UvrABC nuclease subunit
MAWGKLSGLRRIDEIYWHDVENEPGVYLFYRTINGPPRYVGRSDTSLRNRISRRDYLYYKYKHCQNVAEAYHWECEYFHIFETTIENLNHPAKPWYYDLPCHKCGR